MDANREFRISDLKSIFPIVRRRKWLIVLPWILVSAMVLAGTYLMTPMFEASTIISVDTEIKLSDELQRLLGTQPRYAYQRTSEYDRLRGIYNEITSSAYIEKLNEELHLDRDSGIIKSVQKVAASYPDADPRNIALEILRSQLQGQVEVRSAANDQISIRVESKYPRRAANIANRLGEVFISERHKQEMASIRSSQDFSDIQLQKYETQLSGKIREKTSLEQEFIKIQLDESIMDEANRSEITTEIDRIGTEIKEFRDEEMRLLARVAQASNLSTASLSLTDSEDKARAKRELKSQLQSISNLMIKYTWSDPQILDAKLRQNSLMNEIERENGRLVNQQFEAQSDSVQTLLTRVFNVRSNLDYLYSKAAYLRSALDELTDKMNLIPEYQARLNQLDQEIQAVRELRDRFKRQQESSSISQALLQDMSSSKYRVVEPAKTPLAPFAPNKIKIMAMGFILGLLVGAAAATIAELMDSSFKNVDDVESFLGLPVVGIVPKMDFLRHTR